MMKRLEEVLWPRKRGPFTLRHTSSFSVATQPGNCCHSEMCLQDMQEEMSSRYLQQDCQLPISCPSLVIELLFLTGHIANQVKTKISSLPTVKCDNETKFWFLTCYLKMCRTCRKSPLKRREFNLSLLSSLSQSGIWMLWLEPQVSYWIMRLRTAQGMVNQRAGRSRIPDES